jgi:hypothetical protein
MRVILFGGFHLSEQAPVELQSGRQVVERLLEVARSEVRFAQLGIRGNKHKQVLPMDVDE